MNKRYRKRKNKRYRKRKNKRCTKRISVIQKILSIIQNKKGTKKDIEDKPMY